MSAILLDTPARDADCYELIPTTTVAKRPPETAVEFDAPVLLLRKGRDVQLYTVDEFPCGFDGRAFAVTKDSTGEVYHVFAARNGQDSTCDCAGFTYTSNDATGGRCRHLDAITHLLSADRLEHPLAGAPVEPWPSPEQLAAEAGVALPF